MGMGNNDTLITNENLYRALVSAPLAIFFAILAFNSVMYFELVIFKAIFILMALYFSLSTLFYAAFYTNECYAESASEH